MVCLVGSAQYRSWLGSDDLLELRPGEGELSGLALANDHLVLARMDEADKQDVVAMDLENGRAWLLATGPDLDWLAEDGKVVLAEAKEHETTFEFFDLNSGHEQHLSTGDRCHKMLHGFDGRHLDFTRFACGGRSEQRVIYDLATGTVLEVDTLLQKLGRDGRIDPIALEQGQYFVTSRTDGRPNAPVDLFAIDLQSREPTLLAAGLSWMPMEVQVDGDTAWYDAGNDDYLWDGSRFSKHSQASAAILGHGRIAYTVDYMFPEPLLLEDLETGSVRRVPSADVEVTTLFDLQGQWMAAEVVPAGDEYYDAERARILLWRL